MIFSVIILAAGRSKRMNFQKAFLKDRNNNSFIKNQIETYKEIGCNEIVVVVNSKVLSYSLKNETEVFENCIIVTNDCPEEGRFYSVKLGVNALSETDACFLQNVDNPAINREYLELMLTSFRNECWVLPEYKKQTGHPVLINKQIIKKIEKTDTNNVRLNDFLNNFQKIKIAVNTEDIHLNINTLEDYNKYINNLK